jgi:plasmid maintenance system antidote protein VapI
VPGCIPFAATAWVNGSPESWLQLQLQYDLWQAEQRFGTIKVKHFSTPAPC